jgi:hypothetical protein
MNRKNLTVVNRNEDEEENTLFFGGLPTDIELAKLKEAYPATELKVGKIIPYAELEQLLGLDWTSNRFRTVTNRWRRVVEADTNIFIHPDPGYGFKILTESEKLDLSTKKIRTASHAARRAFVVNTRIDRKQLTDDEKAMADHVTQTAAKINASAQLKQRLEMPKL